MELGLPRRAAPHGCVGSRPLLLSDGQSGYVASIPSRRTGLAGQLWDLDNTALLGRLPHSLTTGRGVSGRLGPDPLDDPVCFSLTDLNEFVLQIAALGGHQQRGTLPCEIMAERLISPTAG